MSIVLFIFLKNKKKQNKTLYSKNHKSPSFRSEEIKEKMNDVAAGHINAEHSFLAESVK